MATATETTTEWSLEHQPPYNLILLNDDYHSVDYVIRMMTALFNFSKEKGNKIAKEVHEKGRVIILTGTKEYVEFKQDQIHSFGKDPLVSNSKGSMTAEIEPVV